MADLTYLDTLEAAARAATPGPWLHRHDPGNPVGVQHGVKLPGEFGAWVCDCLDNADRKTAGGLAGQRNAAFVAAANPAVVLALISALRAAAQVAAPAAVPADPLDTPLPCDITVGAGTMRAGVPLRTLVARMKVWHDMAMESPLAQRAAAGPLVATAADGAPCDICDDTHTAFGKRCACAGAEAGGPP